MSGSNFVKDNSGSTAIMFALAIVPVVMMIGGTVDYVGASKTHLALQDAVDAGALAGAKANADPNRESIVRRFVAANASAHVKGGVDSVQVKFDDAAGSVTVTARTKVPTSFIKIAGIDNVDVEQIGTAIWAQSSNRISLVLDSTGSLRHAGIDGDLRAAAIQFIDGVSQGKAVSDVPIAIVPFASMVNVGADKTAWLAPSYDPSAYSPATWSGCVYERAEPNDLTVAPPVAGQFEPHIWPSDYTGGIGFNDWKGKSPADFSNGVIGTKKLLGPNVGCLAPVLPLTDDVAAMKARVNELEMLSASGGTFLSTGLTWGWRTLSKDWVPFWRNGAASKFDNQDGGIIVFLSDGEADWWFEDGNGQAKSVPFGLGITSYGRPEQQRLGIGLDKSAVQVAAETLGVSPTDPNLASLVDADRKSKHPKVDKAVADSQKKMDKDGDKILISKFDTACENAKKAGITIYTILFGPGEIGGNSVKKCASSPQHFFRSPSKSQLQVAFDTIIKSLKKDVAIRLVR